MRSRSRTAAPDLTDVGNATRCRRTIRRRPSGLRQFIREHHRSLLALLTIGIVLTFIFAVLPQIAGFGKSLHRLRYGNKWWLAGGVGLECISLFGYMALLRLMFSCGGVRIAWRSSYQITMAGSVATKLFAAGGAGGIALTVWALLADRALGEIGGAANDELRAAALRRLHAVPRHLRRRPGARSCSRETRRRALTVVPAIFGATVIALALAMGFSADKAARWLTRMSQRRHGSFFKKLATVPGTLHGGVEATIEVLHRPKPSLLGAVVYWAFDIATLWACFRAFGATPPIAVVVLAYYVGQLANALPIPGGIGGVEGGMIGSFIAFGVNGSTAVLAVLAYRIISFWLPILPGSIAYLQLRSSVAKWREQQEAARTSSAQREPETATR